MDDYKGWTVEQKAAFNRCIDYLVLLIQKYGKEFLEEISEKENKSQQ